MMEDITMFNQGAPGVKDGSNAHSHDDAGEQNMSSMLQDIQKQLQQLQQQQTQLIQQQQQTQQQVQELTRRSAPAQQQPHRSHHSQPRRRCSYFLPLRSLYDRLPHGTTTLGTSDWYFHQFGFSGSYSIHDAGGKKMSVELHLSFFNSESPPTELKCRICFVDPAGQRPTMLVTEKSGKIFPLSYQSVEDWARGCSAEVNLRDMKERGYLLNGSLLVRFDVDIID